MDSVNRQYDVVVVGGGHNGLVAASYLSRAGLSVLVLERLDRLGGAPRYSSLIAPVPQAVVADLGLDLRFASRPGASDASALSDEDHAAWQAFRADAGSLAGAVAPTLLEPLPSERVLREQVDPTVWSDLVARPLGETVEARFADDTVRGVVASDALAGSLTSMRDPSLLQNRTFLYHLLGDLTGGGQVPVGGMVALTDALARTATTAGAEIVTSAGVGAIQAGDDGAEVTWHDGAGSHTVSARFVLSNVAPWVLGILLGHGEDPAAKPEGAQVTVDLVLDRLPRLASGTDPEVAFAGPLHLDQGYAELAAAYDDAAAGRLPSVLPGRIVLNASADTPTLTYVGTHTPASLFDRDPEGTTRQVVSRVLASLDRHLAEPIESCLATDDAGRPRIGVTIPQDLERDLALPGGHLFHGDLEWPWAPRRSRLETAAQQWGVQTDVASVLVCGSGSRRGGAVSGLGGHSAAHAVLGSR